MSSMWNECFFSCTMCVCFLSIRYFMVSYLCFCAPFTHPACLTANEFGKQFSHSVVRHIGDLLPFLLGRIPSPSPSPPTLVQHPRFLHFFMHPRARVCVCKRNLLPKLAFQQIPSNPHRANSVHYESFVIASERAFFPHFVEGFPQSGM